MLESVNTCCFCGKKLISTNAAGLNVQPRKCCEWWNGYCILLGMQNKGNVNSSERRCKKYYLN